MKVAQQTLAGHLVLTPDAQLVCGGPAEELEQLLQTVIAADHNHIVVDLKAVPHVDSGGVRALIRGHLTAQRTGGAVTLANLRPPVRRVFAVLRLDTVMTIYDSVDAALARVAGA
jgi:anti-anti-sigma factor